MSSPLRKASMSGSSAISSRATSGRRPQIAKVGVVDDVRRAYRTGSSIAALARAHRVSRGAIRTAVADLLPGRPGATGGQHGQRRRDRAGDGASGDPRQDRPSPARPQRPGRDRTTRPAARTYGCAEGRATACTSLPRRTCTTRCWRRRTDGRRRRGPQGIPHLCRPTHRRGDSDRPGAVTSSPVGGMTALLACSRALRGAPE
jgi:hypothetical protein